jgi:hypothetical protein
MISRRLAPLVFVALPFLVACSKSLVCTAEVTEGSGTFKAVAQGRGAHRPAIEREAIAAACEQLCVATRKADPRAACVSRCAVDAAVGTIGVRTSCLEGSL